jgi:hypothetical protein
MITPLSVYRPPELSAEKWLPYPPQLLMSGTPPNGASPTCLCSTRLCWPSNAAAGPRFLSAWDTQQGRHEVLRTLTYLSPTSARTPHAALRPRETRLRIRVSARRGRTELGTYTQQLSRRILFIRKRKGTILFISLICEQDNASTLHNFTQQT